MANDKHIKVGDLKPSKDAKGGGSGRQGSGRQGSGRQGSGRQGGTKNDKHQHGDPGS